MAHTLIPRSNWFHVEGDRFPTVLCPKDPEHACIGGEPPHGITAKGEVWNSVVCPYPGCGFHAFVQLEGWDRDELPHK